MNKTPFRADTPARRVALFGMLLALTVALSWLERLIPTDTIVLGAKLGLANLVSCVDFTCSRCPGQSP